MLRIRIVVARAVSFAAGLVVTAALLAVAALSPTTAAPAAAAGRAAAGATGTEAAGTRLLREPTVSKDAIVFVYADDLWTVGRDGGVARRLTTFPGAETDPHFSPDGKWIAFTGNYSGNADVYVIPAEGGEPRRLTWHPGLDQACGWTPDGTRVLFASGRTNPFGVPSAPLRQLWTIPVDGGLPERLPIPTALRGSFSDDGRSLAWEVERWQDEWRNYRGGQAQPIRILSLADLSVQAVPGPASMNQQPVFLGGRLYFLSDRDGRFNVYEYDPATQAVRALTQHRDFDARSLAAGGGMLVYEQGGWLHALDPKSGASRRLVIEVTGDFPWAMPQWKDVSGNIAAASLSPTGTRALFEARGEVFTVPAEKGDVRDLSRDSGAADRSPVWSPDGRSIAWFSDRSGEYRLYISDQDGLETPREIVLDHPTFYFDPAWSPDSKRLAFTDEGRNLWVVDVATGKATRADTDRMAHPERSLVPVWSPDSRFIAYAKQLPNQYRGIMVYSIEDGHARMVTDGMSDAVHPAWDRSGKYLFFLASTDLALNTGWLDLSSLERPLRRGIYFAVLARDVPSPLLPESDEEKGGAGEAGKDSGKGGGKGSGKEGASAASGKGAGDHDKAGGGEKTAEPAPVRIDFDGIGSRILALPMPLRNYTALQTGAAGVVFVTEAALPFPEQDNGEAALTLHRWDMGKRKASVFLPGIAAFAVSADGGKVLYQAGPDWGIVPADGEPKPGDGKLKFELRMRIDPPAEWRQIYHEAWRFERDFFYVRNHHGADWNAVGERYAEWLPDVRHRADLSYLIDLMGGEHGVGHHFVRGGDEPKTPSPRGGLLGADFKIDKGRYRITRIYTGENWNPDLESPLAAPGIDVREGDYLIAVDGREVVPPASVYAALEGTAGRQTVITVNDKPSADGARRATVVPVGDEGPLRRRAWVEDNRRAVDRLSGGKLAYVWLPNTAEAGYTYFNRYYFAQRDRQGAVLDERFNGGGFIADYIIDIVARHLRGYFNNPVGDRVPWTEPLSGIWGPKVMIINEFAGSGGDMMPYMFHQEAIGPLVGHKTWGGLVGIWDYPTLIDGGRVSIPRGGFFNLQGEWDVENKGVPPDIEVEITPKDFAAGRDPQLEKAVAEALRLLEKNPVHLLKEPASPVRVGP
jgi:tricorn protease